MARWVDLRAFLASIVHYEENRGASCFGAGLGAQGVCLKAIDIDRSKFIAERMLFNKDGNVAVCLQ